MNNLIAKLYEKSDKNLKKKMITSMRNIGRVKEKK